MAGLLIVNVVNLSRRWLLRVLMAPAEPPSAAVAVLGLLGVTALVLWAASRAIRRLEINYGTD